MKLSELQKWAQSLNEDRQGRVRVLVGTGTCGRAAAALEVLEAIRKKVSTRNINAVITETGCIGLCYAEPFVEIIKPGRPGICYGYMTPEKATDLVVDYLENDNPRSDLALGTIGTDGFPAIPRLFELPALKPQVRIVLRNCGQIDPTDIRDSILNSGYTGLSRALNMKPEEVIAEVKAAGLRGRGGAGFPTGLKWELCHKEPGNEKYLVCNFDEGDPGAFMNRLLLESDPHSVLEGMLIAAYAIGARYGYIYCRAEKPLAIERLGIAIKQMEGCGLLGSKILDFGFGFQMEVRRGGGVFVCGEETALLASIEGKRGMPRPRPPFPTTSGLWGKPTCINNVETLANVAAIFQKDARWFSGFGTEKSRGTKTFALAGKIERTGLIEVPIGMTLGDLVYDIGGGIPGGKSFKAIFTGGPSGGCLPASMLGLPVDYESLAQAGSIMGSGGMIVADENTCMVDLAKFFLAFTQAESCGKCSPCRTGTGQMLRILERITGGKGEPGDIELLERIARTVKAGSLCGLGQTAPNPVLTTIRYFREEYEEHISERYCRAGVCKDLVLSPCQNTCPAGIDVPRYVRKIAEGKPQDAYKIIREKVPFPGVLGYVCMHPCEAKCRRGQLDEAVSIRGLKRHAFEERTKPERYTIHSPPLLRAVVAVVGSGPAGLAAAYYLARLGYRVTIFEQLPVPGGMMRVGIPEFRLPRLVLDEEITEIESLGVHIKTNTRIESLDALKEYDAVFVGTGADYSQDIGIPGEEAPLVLSGVDFLERVALGEHVSIGENVLIIGGGNVAIDAARTAIRLGRPQVTVFYRRTLAEMPAERHEIDSAIQEGVDIHYLTTPVGIEECGGRLRVWLRRMVPGKFDYSGRRSPVPVDGSDFSVDCDMLVKAVGEIPHIPEAFGLALDTGGKILVNRNTLATSRSGVFAGGDTVSGPASVIEAIAAGKRAAASIDRYLGGKGIVEDITARILDDVALRDDEETEGARVRMSPRELPLSERTGCFKVTDLGFDAVTAIAEAERCLWCDLEDDRLFKIT